MSGQPVKLKDLQNPQAQGRAYSGKDKPNPGESFSEYRNRIVRNPKFVYDKDNGEKSIGNLTPERLKQLKNSESNNALNLNANLEKETTAATKNIVALKKDARGATTDSARQALLHAEEKAKKEINSVTRNREANSIEAARLRVLSDEKHKKLENESIQRLQKLQQEGLSQEIENEQLRKSMEESQKLSNKLQEDKERYNKFTSAEQNTNFLNVMPESRPANTGNPLTRRKLAGNENYFSNQDPGTLTCGRNALNNLLGGDFFIKESRGIKGDNLSIISQPPVALQDICRFLQSYKTIEAFKDLDCPDNEDYDISVLRVGLGVLGYSSEYIARNTFPNDDTETIGYLINIGNDEKIKHWVALVRLETGGYRYKDSLNPPKNLQFEDYNTFNEFYTKYSNIINQIYRIKFTGKFVNIETLEISETSVAEKSCKFDEGMTINYNGKLYLIESRIWEPESDSHNIMHCSGLKAWELDFSGNRTGTLITINDLDNVTEGVMPSRLPLQGLTANMYIRFGFGNEGGLAPQVFSLNDFVKKTPEGSPKADPPDHMSPLIGNYNEFKKRFVYSEDTKEEDEIKRIMYKYWKAEGPSNNEVLYHKHTISEPEENNFKIPDNSDENQGDRKILINIFKFYKEFVGKRIHDGQNSEGRNSLMSSAYRIQEKRIDNYLRILLEGKEDTFIIKKEEFDGSDDYYSFLIKIFWILKENAKRKGNGRINMKDIISGLKTSKISKIDDDYYKPRNTENPGGVKLRKGIDDLYALLNKLKDESEKAAAEARRIAEEAARLENERVTTAAITAATATARRIPDDIAVKESKKATAGERVEEAKPRVTPEDPAAAAERERQRAAAEQERQRAAARAAELRRPREKAWANLRRKQANEDAQAAAKRERKEWNDYLNAQGLNGMLPFKQRENLNDNELEAIKRNWTDQGHRIPPEGYIVPLLPLYRRNQKPFQFNGSKFPYNFKDHPLKPAWEKKLKKGGGKYIMEENNALHSLLSEQLTWEDLTKEYDSIESEYQSLLPEPGESPLQRFLKNFHVYIDENSYQELLEDADGYMELMRPELVEDLYDETQEKRKEIMRRIMPFYKRAMPHLNDSQISPVILAHLLRKNIF